jgi:hypothetical protein
MKILLVNYVKLLLIQPLTILPVKYLFSYSNSYYCVILYLEFFYTLDFKCYPAKRTNSVRVIIDE